MEVREMHYAFKMGFNKIDSNQNRDLLIPEIDFFLNRAQHFFINNIMFPRSSMYKYPGFEGSQRNTDDIRTLVVSEKPILVTSDLLPLPEDYLHFIRGRALGKRGSCVRRDIVLYVRQHDDLFEENPFFESNFLWKTLNGVFTDGGIKLYHKDFDVEEVYLTYVRKPKYIHNAQDFGQEGTYTDFSGIPLTGFQNCELPETSHESIVDIAVFLATGSINSPEYNIKKEKLNLNQTF